MNLLDLNIVPAALFDFLSDSFIKYLLSSDEFYAGYPLYMVKCCIRKHTSGTAAHRLLVLLLSNADRLEIYPFGRLPDFIEEHERAKHHSDFPRTDGEFIQCMITDIFSKIFDQYPGLIGELQVRDFLTTPIRQTLVMQRIDRICHFTENLSPMQYSINGICLQEIANRIRNLWAEWHEFDVLIARNDGSHVI